MRVADYIAKFIYDMGIHDIFMVSGAGVMHLTDGVAKHGKLNAVCTHHEQSASMAVEAYARANEHFGVAYFSTGPAATNAITGLAGAWQDSVPCLYISGQVKRVETEQNAGIEGLRQFGVQELDIIPVVDSLTKYSIFLDDPNKIRYELEKLVHIAKSGRPGPVWLDVPMDVQAATIDENKLIGFEPQIEEQVKFQHDGQLEQLRDMLLTAQRPVIIAGRGIRLSGAIEALQKLVAKFNIPVVTPYLAIDNLPTDSEFFIGKTGVKGDRAANFAMQNSDLILSIGSSLHVTVIGYDYNAFAREAKKVIVDIDETAHKKKTIKADMFILSDAKIFIEQLQQLSSALDINYTDWLKRCGGWKDRYKVCLEEYKETKGAINIYSFVDQLSEQSASGDIFVSDAGSAYYAMSQGIRLTKPKQRYITSGAMATMGFTLPAAIGISVATNNGRVLAVTGDGSLQMNIQELQTIIHYNLPVKIFVLNNDGYLSIRASQKNYFEKRFIGESDESGVSFPDTLKIAAAYGIKAIRVDDLNDLEGVIDEVLDFDGPVICDVICPKEQAIIPTVSSVVNEDGSMSSRPLEDMAPFLEREEYRSNLIVEEI